MKVKQIYEFEQYHNDPTNVFNCVQHWVPYNFWYLYLRTNKLWDRKQNIIFILPFAGQYIIEQCPSFQFAFITNYLHVFSMFQLLVQFTNALIK